MKTFKLLLHVLFAIGHVLVVLLFLVSAFSDRISPEKHLMFSYIGLAFPVFMFANFLFILYWLIISKWKTALVGVVAFIIAWGPVTSYLPFHSMSVPVPEESLKVLTYNVMGFAYKNHTADSPNRIVEYIADSGADIVCIQEYSVSKGGNNLTAKRLNRALKMYPFRSVIELNSNKYQSVGLAIFSKYPIEHSRRIKYKSAFNGSAMHEINIKGKKITLVNNHLESFKLTMEDRSKYSQIIGNLGSEALVELKGTLQQKLGTAFQIRAGQAESVAKEVKEANGEYVLVCGYFNDTPISYAHRTIQGDLVDAFSESGRGLGISYNQNKFWFRIDNILHSSNIKSYRCTVDKVRYSDHYPMWCYITFE